MKYALKLPDANFEIVKEPQGLWDLWINGMPTLTFPNPEEAAKAVHEHRAGWAAWDNSPNEPSPEDLTGWTEIT